MSMGVSPNNAAMEKNALRGKWAAGGPVLALPAQKAKHAPPTSPRGRPAHERLHEVHKEQVEKSKQLLAAEAKKAK